MTPPSTPRPKSATRIIALVFGIYFTANFITALICYLQPKIYSSTGIFSESAEPDRSISVAGAHAARIVDSLDLDLRWDISFDEAVQRIKENVVIQTSASQTVIYGQFSSPQDTRMIVETLMESYPGFEREQQWAQLEGLDDRYTEKERETARQINWLTRAILQTLDESGALTPGTLITSETVSQIGNDDVIRQFKAYQKLNDPPGRFGPPDGNLFIPPPVLAIPIESMGPSSPDIDSYFLIGRVIGIIIAIITLLLVFRFKPSLIEAPPQKPIRTPVFDEIGEDATSGPASW